MPTRRQALKSLLAAGAGTLLSGFYTWRIEPHWLEFTAPALPISGLPSALEGRTLAQLSDLHVGPEVDNAYIVHSLQRLQEHAPDFIVITGDWISYRGQQQLEQLRHVLEHLPHGRLGTLGILGNHDYGRSWSMTDVAKQVDQVASEAGVTMLRNRVVTLAGLQFIGVDDLWSPCFDPVTALAQRASAVPAIALCHNPDAADLAVWGDYEGWILAGHTHGGQCKPPFLPPPE